MLEPVPLPKDLVRVELCDFRHGAERVDVHPVSVPTIGVQAFDLVLRRSSIRRKWKPRAGILVREHDLYENW